MSYLKTTNIVEDKEFTETSRQVECPYCHCGLRNIPRYITAMKCWQCHTEFRIEQDQSKFTKLNKEHGSKTLIRGNQIM